MSKNIKNSLILGIALILIAAFSYYWLKVLKENKVIQLTAVKAEKEKEFDDLSIIAVQYDEVKTTLDTLIKSLYELDKVLLPVEDTKISFEYINSLASIPNSYINFTFVSGERNEYENYYGTNYMLSGEASFYNFYNFIWKLENYKRLYSISSMTLEEIKKSESQDEEPKSYIKFNMSVTGYSSKEKIGSEEEITEDKTSEPLRFNPFLPLVQENIPPNTEGLLEVDNAELQGLTNDRAFITDARGNFLVMKAGDRVYLGYLTRISPERNQVEFTLNKGGFIETFILKLKEKKQ